MSIVAKGEVEDDVSPFEQQTPDSLRARALSPHLHDLLSTSDEQDLSADSKDDYFSQHKPSKRSTSGTSSISSFPASVIHNTLLTDNEDVPSHTNARTQTFTRANSSPGGGHLSAFRHSSSVRALQLESEYADSDAFSLKDSPRVRKSPYYRVGSPGSIHSSPTKRSSRPGTPRQQSTTKLKKEFPLVLLHCSLLPPAFATNGHPVSDEILEAVLPEEYRKRWKILQDKVAKNTEIRQRGVLISHPREDYDLLEERLLETLELERPRIRKGHYLGSRKSGGSDSGFESSSQNGTDEGSDEDVPQEDEPGEKCPDCGKAVSCKADQERRWRVKVFAANGLMRGDAWAAAWSEMEKVDVEIGVWMPDEVRNEVEERLKALHAKEEAEKPVEEPIEAKKKSRKVRSVTAKLRHDERMREIYGETPSMPSQEEIEGLVDKKPVVGPSTAHNEASGHNGRPIQHAHPPTAPVSSEDATRIQVDAQESFTRFMQRHLQVLWNDQKNLAIVLLSVLVLFFSIQNTKKDNALSQATKPSISVAPSEATMSPEPPSLSYVTTTVFATPSGDPNASFMTYSSEKGSSLDNDGSEPVALPTNEVDSQFEAATPALEFLTADELEKVTELFEPDSEFTRLPPQVESVNVDLEAFPGLNKEESAEVVVESPTDVLLRERAEIPIPAESSANSVSLAAELLPISALRSDEVSPASCLSIDLGECDSASIEQEMSDGGSSPKAES